ncbi:YbdK family carboxylate-amine ligase [Streptomyces sp. WAC05374]|uniref:carboxylate-amine ligase n=1 Tax=Streptomyces sp. WAC05374 TaxID=2487420 RepID=UPI000F883033|nr:glutamate--cysteine ligase [Streptomyces sp. WAC05374]RST09639.1 YbdK family carboxylate-amine ligase [Streptomyces sp. WAC05374]TDF50560.1 YbdK family carboxylate-amine ligase [Streptomyces sp. WAC05374]TDF56849.1 YbdK family carboxylate-amine ligase [Streptomyces sp. WAC05374]TDF60812.1 YbdK family carboxylate-amine ligase [Streptomyces sp. WAC05374]
MKSEKWTSTDARPSTTGDDPSPRTTGTAPPVTVGVEEEYLLVDPVSRHVSTRADKVVAEAAAELGDRVTTELTRYQVEIRTRPHTDLVHLGEELRATRRAVARAAAALGLRIVSSGTPVLGQHTPPPLTTGDRYARSLATFRALDHEQTACACHVHIGVPDLATALGVSNHLRPWLPALIALAANSPYWAARDTGYASWRTLTWGRWPAAGPPPFFESVSHFEGLVDRLLTSETLLDRGGLYWDIRPSHHVPTLEFRIADAVPTVDDTLLVAAAVKGLATAALTAVRDARPAPRPQPELLRAAYWRAARDGVRGRSINLHTGRLEPAAAHLARLWDTALPALAPVDRTAVRAARRHLDSAGNGADRQRAAYRRRHSLHDVVDHLIDQATA